MLGRAAVVVTAVLALLLLATMIRVAGWPYFIKRGWVTDRSRASYAEGDHIDLDAAVYTRAAHTVILFARSNCGACEAAMPFHQSLVTLIAAHPTARIVLVSPIDRTRELPYAHALGLGDDALVPWPTPAPRVQAAPTIVLVDRTGLILGAWEGASTDAARQEITAAITKTISGS